MKRRNWLGYFLNPYQKHVPRGIIHYLLWRFGFYKDETVPEPLPLGFKYPNDQSEADLSAPHATWINHSTFWVMLDGKGILVDPIWNERCSPIPFIGPKRHHLPSHSLLQLQKVDYVIASHNHYDHLDKKTVKQINQLYPNVTWIVPLKVKKWVHKVLPTVEKERVIELDWWEKFQNKDFTFTAVPAQHFSGRGLFDKNRSLWMGCVIESERSKKRVYFAGDTGYNPIDFKKIGQMFGSMDLSLIPIGVYTPRRFMCSVHINPVESLAIHNDVNSKLSIGGHFGTFKLSSDAITRPPFDLYRALEKEKTPWESFRVLKPGQYINW